MHGFAQRIIAAEREREVADASAHFCKREVLLDPFYSFDEIDGVVVMFLNTRGNGQDVGIEYDIFGRYANFADKDIVSAPAYFPAAGQGAGLSFLVESHHYHGCAIISYFQRMFPENIFAFLQAD